MSFVYTDTTNEKTQLSPLAKTTNKLCKFVMDFIPIKIIYYSNLPMYILLWL